MFTVNNYSLVDFDCIETLVGKCQFVITGFEVGKEGTPHIQGYAELLKPTRFNTIKKMIPRAYMAPRKGTQEEAIEYCKKEGNWLVFGKQKEQGHRSDLHGAKALALEGGMRAITDAFDNVQVFKVAATFLTYNEPERDFVPKVIWLWGKTGTGKSRRAREICDTDDTFTKNQGTKWWDGYDGHDCVIIDDFRDSWWPITYMLALTDRYGFQVECKGGSRQMRAHTMIITSAYSPADCYRGCGEAIDQLLRRITEVHELLPRVADVAEVVG